MYRNLPYNPRQPFFQSTPRPSFPNRTLIDPKEVNATEIQKLFGVAMSGNITELKKIIKSIGLTISDMVDSNGKNILHVIIENENLNNSNKTECIRFLNKHSGLKMSYNSDENFTTPLHAACKLQLDDVAKILIEAGHDVNAEDANGKTPLYYALTPLETSCPDPKKSSTKKVKIDKLSVKSLTEQIFNIIDVTDTEYNMIFSHINNSCKLLPEIFSQEMNNKNKFFQERIKTILLKKDEQDKVSQITELSLNFKNDLVRFFKEKLKNSMDITKFKQDDNFWGPDDNPQNRILKPKDVDVFKTELIKDINKQKEKLIKELTSQIDIDDILNDVEYNICEPIDEVCNLYFIYLNFLIVDKLQINVGEGDNQSIIPDVTEDITENINKFNNLIEYKNTKIFIDRYLNRNIKYNLGTFSIPRDNELIFIQQDGSEIKNGNFYTDYYLFKNIDFIKNINIDSKNVQKIKEVIVNQYKISEDDILELSDSSGSDDSLKDPFTRKVKEIIRRMREYNNTIKKNIIRNKLIDKNIDNIEIKSIYDNCINIQFHILSMMNYLSLLKKEIKILSINLIDVINFIKDFYEKTIAIKNYKIYIYDDDEYIPIAPLFKYLLDCCNEIKNKINDSIVNSLFTNMKTSYNTLNKIIDFINSVSSTRYLLYYYNNYNNFDTFFTNPNTDQINFIYDKTINNIIEINRLEDIQHTEDIEDITIINANKKYLIETYIPQLTNNYYFNYIDTTNLNPQLGFLYNVPADPKPFGFVYPITYNTILLTGNIATPPVTNANITTLVGNYGEILKISLIKSKHVIHSIGNYIDKHFNILKYYFIRKVLSKINNEFTKDITVNPIDPKYLSLIEDLKSKNKLLKEKLDIPENDNHLLLILLASTLDEIFISQINKFIVNTVNQYKATETIDVTKITYNEDMLINIDTINDKVITATNKYVSELLSKGKYRTISYSLTYGEEIEQKMKKSVFRRYFENILNNDDKTSCYKINFDLINLLINNRANLNKKDRDGTTVLFNLIDNNNYEIFRKIFIDVNGNKRMTVYNKYSKNLNGVSPYNYALKHLSYYTEIFTNKKLIDDIIDNINVKIAKKTNNDVIFRYQTQIYNMIFILLNHYIFMTALQYINGYTFDENNKLFQLLGMTENDIFPIIQLIKSEKLQIDKYRYADVLVDNELDDINFKDQESIQEDKKRANLTKEFIMYPDTKVVTLRELVIDKDIQNINKKIESDLNPGLLHDETVRLNNIKEKTKEKNRTTLNDNILKRIDNFDKSSNIIDMYESITTKIFNTNDNKKVFDLKTYMNLWKLYIDENNKNNTMIINNISSKLLNLTKNQKPSNIMLDELKTIGIFFSKIINKIGKDYIEIESVYNGDNYLLNDILSIIKHVIKHTMMVNLYNIIQQLIKKVLTSMYLYSATIYKNEESYNKIIDDKIKNIMTASYNKQEILHNFIFENLPEILIKTTLEIYEDDSEKTKLKLQDQFDFIKKIIEPQLGDSYKNIREEMIKVNKYFTEYLTENCKQMKLIMDGFIHCVINLGEAVNITVDVVDKALQEEKIIMST
jgi:hypothetical protein